MLVLNRRPGESIIIEPDIRATVLSVSDGQVWIGLRTSGAMPDLRMSATLVSDTAPRLEIGPLVSVELDTAGVRVRSAPASHPAAAMQAGLALSRRVGERVDVDGGLWIEVGILPKGNPFLAFGGPSVGARFALAIVRVGGNYVRIGVDAPNRGVYRAELWDAARTATPPPPGKPSEATVAEAVPG